jgi:hypothetical protein
MHLTPVIGWVGRGFTSSSARYGLRRRSGTRDTCAGLASPKRCRAAAQGTRFIRLALPLQILETLVASGSEAWGMRRQVTSSAQDRRRICAVDGACNSLDILLSRLIVQIFLSPFCADYQYMRVSVARRGQCHLARVLARAPSRTS